MSENSGLNKSYDIKIRSFEFALEILKFVSSLPKTVICRELGKQLIRSGTSVGANIEEADGSLSKKEFVYKIGLSLKEAKETKYWIKLLIDSGIPRKESAELLFKESEELVKIFGKIISTTKKNNLIK